jgi:hypothetical protein
MKIQMRSFYLLLIILQVAAATAQNVPPLIPLDSFRGDTAKFVETNLANRKALYENQKMAVLIKDLSLPVRSYYLERSHVDPATTPKMVVFYSDVAAHHLSMYSQKDDFALVITWEKPQPTAVTKPLYKAGDGSWLQAENDYYGECVVKDVYFSPKRQR